MQYCKRVEVGKIWFGVELFRLILTDAEVQIT